jgi:hypothetical protein
MASNGNVRGKLLTAGGILSIVAGIYLIGSGVSVAARLLLVHGVSPGDWGGISAGNWGGISPGEGRLLLLGVGYFGPFPFIFYFVSFSWVIIAGCVGVLGIVAIVGGISAIRRKRFGLALAGAICAILSGPLGILAVVFIALRKREFGGEGISGIGVF